MPQLKRGWEFQQHNDPKHTSKSTMKYLQERQMKILVWPSQYPDLNIIENMWRDLQHTIHARRLKNICELAVFCQGEWGKFQKWELKHTLLTTGSLQAVIVASSYKVELTGLPNILTGPFYFFDWNAWTGIFFFKGMCTVSLKRVM